MEEEAGVAKGKERRVTFRMEGGDYDALCERCERAGLSKSEYLRYFVRIPLSTEANAGDEHRILVDRRALWAMSRELTKWGYHYNQAVHAMNLINFHARHGHVEARAGVGVGRGARIGGRRAACQSGVAAPQAGGPECRRTRDTAAGSRPHECDCR